MIYQNFRCSSCDKLLFKGILVDSGVEVKCRGCGAMNEFKGVSKDRLICFKPECSGRVSFEDVAPTNG